MNTGYTSIDFVLAALAVVVLPVLSARSGRSLARAATSRRGLAPRYLWIIFRSVVVGALIIGAWLKLGRPFSELGLGIPIGRWGIVGFAIDGLIAADYIYAIFLRKRSPEQLEAVRQRLSRMRAERILPRRKSEVALFHVVAVVGSITEELLYRGFLIAFITPLTGVVGAVFLSSIVFGLGHVYLGAIGVARTSVIGLAFAIGLVATQSLWWVMLAHVLVNSFAAPLYRRLQRVAGHDNSPDVAGVAPLTLT